MKHSTKTPLCFVGDVTLSVFYTVSDGDTSDVERSESTERRTCSSEGLKDWTDVLETESCELMLNRSFYDLYEDRWNVAKLEIFHVTVTRKSSGFILYSFVPSRGLVREVKFVFLF